jgi:hypothetical protein
MAGGAAGGAGCGGGACAVAGGAGASEASPSFRAAGGAAGDSTNRQICKTRPPSVCRSHTVSRATAGAKTNTKVPTRMIRHITIFPL